MKERKTPAELANETLEKMVLTGSDVRRLMRKNKITIRSLAKRMNVTLKMVRRYRADDSDLVGHSAAEIYERLTGSRRIYLCYCARAGRLPLNEPNPESVL